MTKGRASRRALSRTIPDRATQPLAQAPSRDGEGLEDFKTAYVAYLEGDSRDELRRAVIDGMPAAQRALDAAKFNVQLIDPPAMGAHRMVYTGLSNLAFLHEQPGWGGDDNPPHEAVIFNLDAARAHLADAVKQEGARRRSPLYWIDRALRALLMIPAYLAGLIVGQSTIKIDRSALGLPLRLLAIPADALGVYGAGTAFGWW